MANSQLNSRQKLERIISIAELWINKLNSINYLIDKGNYQTYEDIRTEIMDLRANKYRVDNLIQEFASDFPAKAVFTSVKTDIETTFRRYEVIQGGGKPQPFVCTAEKTKKTYYGNATSSTYGKFKRGVTSVGTSIKNTTVNAYNKVVGYFKGPDPYQDDIYERKPYLRPEQEEGFLTKVKRGWNNLGNSVKSKLYGDNDDENQ